MAALPHPHDPSWLIELQSLLLATDTLTGFLDETAALTARTLDGHISVGITLQPDRRPLTVAASDALARAVDEIQYQVDEGPCLESMRTGRTHYITDLREEARWPAFIGPACGQGVRSVLSTPLQVGADTLGALNLYAPDPDAFDAAAQQKAAATAECIGAAAAIALRLSEAQDLSTNLRTALSSRATIDQAIGILMAQRRISARAAFALLRKTSQDRNLKLNTLAAAIVASYNDTPEGT